MRRPLQGVTGTIAYEGRLEEKVPVIIHDISLSGCKIEFEDSIELNGKVLITIDTESLTDQPAIAVWTSQNADVQWPDSSLFSLKSSR